MTKELDAINQRLVQLVSQGSGSTTTTGTTTITGGTAPAQVQTAPLQ
jgi:hypothetical protein